MRILTINTFNNFSTGNIMVDIIKKAKSEGHEICCLYGRCKNSEFGEYIGTNKLLNKISSLFVYLTGLIGHFHYIETNKILKKIKSFKPDIIHIHNLHGNFCNFNRLMKYIYKNKIKLILTAEDFWYATGRCAHHLGCDRWKDGCGKCPNKKAYMRTFLFDHSRKLLNEKIKWFGLIKPTLVCPSKWILNDFKISKIGGLVDLKLIYNGADEATFRCFNYKKEGPIRIIGIASRWSHLKGLDTFNKLAEDLDKKDFEITLVGVLPETKTHKKINRIELTTNKKELAELYNRADLFVNPTLVDTFPTTNIESLLCGTPVFVYDVCGAAEAIDDESGLSIQKNNYSNLLESIKHFKRSNFNQRNIKKRGLLFSKTTFLNNYMNLYKEVYSNHK